MLTSAENLHIALFRHRDPFSESENVPGTRVPSIEANLLSVGHTRQGQTSLMSIDHPYECVKRHGESMAGRPYGCPC